MRSRTRLEILKSFCQNKVAKQSEKIHQTFGPVSFKNY